MKDGEPLGLWITHAGQDDPGNPQEAAAELLFVGIRAFYDDVPAEDLWEAIAEPVEDPALDGYAYILTPSTLGDPLLRDEIARAAHEVRRARGPQFPVLALLQAVQADRVPPALRGSRAVSLSDPDWKEQIRAAMRGEPPPGGAQTTLGRYRVKVHRGVGGNPRLTAVEIQPRAPELRHWRIGVPVACQTLAAWGRARRGGIQGRQDLYDLDRNDVVTGILKVVGPGTCVFQGCGDPIDHEKSAYALFDGPPPPHVVFARADFPDGKPVLEEEIVEIPRA